VVEYSQAETPFGSSPPTERRFCVFVGPVAMVHTRGLPRMLPDASIAPASTEKATRQGQLCRMRCAPAGCILLTSSPVSEPRHSA